MCFCLIAGDGRKSINEKEEKHTHASVPLVCECLPELVTETDENTTIALSGGEQSLVQRKHVSQCSREGGEKQRDVKQAQICGELTGKRAEFQLDSGSACSDLDPDCAYTKGDESHRAGHCLSPPG